MSVLKFTCKHCGNIFTREKSNIRNKGTILKYCSKECVTESLRKEPLKLMCQQCSKIFYKKHSQMNKNSSGQFCSRQCMYDARTKQSDEKREKVRDLYKQGKSYKEIVEITGITHSMVTHYVGKGRLNRAIQKKSSGSFPVRAKREIGRKCELCGYSRYTEVAHIIPKRHEGRDKINNVLILCPNCHRLFDHELLSNNEIEILLLIDRVKDSLCEKYDVTPLKYPLLKDIPLKVIKSALCKINN